jgi:hypothetical protein
MSDRGEKRSEASQVGLSACSTSPTLVIEATRPERSDKTPPSGAYRYQPGPPLDRWIRFGDWLVRRGLISRADLYCALRRATSERVRIGDALVAGALLPRAEVEREANAFQSFQRNLRAGERPRAG